MGLENWRKAESCEGEGASASPKKKSSRAKAAAPQAQAPNKAAAQHLVSTAA
jgi:hypothetical protein